jgi:hypothetical protein
VSCRCCLQRLGYGLIRAAQKEGCGNWKGSRGCWGIKKRNGRGIVHDVVVPGYGQLFV